MTLLTERGDPHTPDTVRGISMKTKIAHFLLHLLEEAPFGPVSESAAFQPGGS